MQGMQLSRGRDEAVSRRGVRECKREQWLGCVRSGVHEERVKLVCTEAQTGLRGNKSNSLVIWVW